MSATTQQTRGDCVFCQGSGGIVLYQNRKLRIVAVEGEDARDYAGFCRVIWNEHIKEMSDLASEDRAVLMRTVFALESTLRLSLQPDKINLASLGNMTPHVHWHVIPRYVNDRTYPQPIWAKTERLPSVHADKTSTSWHDAVRAAFAGPAWSGDAMGGT